MDVALYACACARKKRVYTGHKSKYKHTHKKKVQSKQTSNVCAKAVQKVYTSCLSNMSCCCHSFLFFWCLCNCCCCCCCCCPHELFLNPLSETKYENSIVCHRCARSPKTRGGQRIKGKGPEIGGKAEGLKSRVRETRKNGRQLAASRLTERKEWDRMRGARDSAFFAHILQPIDNKSSHLVALALLHLYDVVNICQC